MGKSLYTIISSTRTVQEMPATRQPREMFDRMGAENVSEETLLALILRSGTQGHNVLDMARGLLDHFGSLSAMRKASREELMTIPGIGPVMSQVLKAALELGHRMGNEFQDELTVVDEPAAAARLLKQEAQSREQEVFWILMLDRKNQLIRPPFEASIGLLDSCLVHPREVFREAIRNSCAGVILAHNHPSGNPEPSPEDIRITRELIKAGKIIDIHVLDHIVIGKETASEQEYFFSIRESGLVQFEG